MGEQKNLTEENVEELKKQLKKMKDNNPELEYRFFEQDSHTQERDPSKEEHPSLKEIFERIESLERKIDRIFGDHILIKGYFQDISNLENTLK